MAVMMNFQKRIISSCWIIVGIAGIIWSTGLCEQVQADRTWANYTDGVWTNAGSWSPVGIPSNEVASIHRNYTVTLDSAVPDITGLDIWSDSPGILAITNGADLTASGSIKLGNGGSPAEILHYGGTFTSSGSFDIGPSSINISTNCLYIMSGGLLHKTGGYLVVCPDVDGSNCLFQQSGGTVLFDDVADGLTVSYNSEYRLEDGLLDLGGNDLRVRSSSKFNFTGGIIQGVASFPWGTAFVQDGGLFKVGHSISSNSATTIATSGINSYTMNSGITEFDIFGGSGTNDYFFLDGTDQSINLSAGTVHMNFNNYYPQVGDTYDLIQGSAGPMALSTTNITTSIINLGLDLSQWLSSGIIIVKNLPPHGTIVSIR